MKLSNTKTYEDTYTHKGLRMQLILQLRERGITDEKILSAINFIPRHWFLDNAFTQRAYQDKAFDIGQEQTISQPYMVALQTSLLNVEPKYKVLEIGTGSGYQAAVLACMGAEVYSIEIDPILHKSAQNMLKVLDDKLYDGVPFFQKHINLFLGDGTKGLPDFAPYLGVIVTAGAPEIPLPYLSQVFIAGKVIIPIGGPKKQKMNSFMRVTENEYLRQEFEDCSFVPLLGEHGWGNTKK